MTPHEPDSTDRTDAAFLKEASKGFFEREDSGLVAIPKSVHIIREITSSLLKLGLGLGVGFGVIAVVGYFFWNSFKVVKTLEDAEVLGAAFLAPLTTLLGVAVGYAFGDRKNSHRS